MRGERAALIAVGILAAAGSLSAKNPKLGGKVLDPERFQNVHSYCVQTQDLGSYYAGMVKSFFNGQRKPNGLVNELPWKLVSDCSQADAVMSFHAPGRGLCADASCDVYWWCILRRRWYAR
jgi:hypothetical protein